MFRKPKRPANKVGLRKKPGHPDDDEEDIHEGSTKDTIHDGDDENDDDGRDEETTLELQEARKRVKLTANKKAKDDTVSSNPSSVNIMHRVEASSESGSGQPSQKDLATSSNEYLPIKSTVNPTRNKFLAGPIRAPTNIRTTARFDYQPDICKDYKDTGFCGFGDTCIYLHDRGDTMSGWQLEQAWQKKQESKKQQQERQMEAFLNGTSATGDGDSDDGNLAAVGDDGLPFACHLCRGAFDEPIITPCGHYFCQSCLQKQIQNSNDSKCPICQKETHGVMNQPTKLIAKKRKLLGRNATWQEFMDARRNKKTISTDDGDV